MAFNLRSRQITNLCVSVELFGARRQEPKYMLNSPQKVIFPLCPFKPEVSFFVYKSVMLIVNGKLCRLYDW